MEQTTVRILLVEDDRVDRMALERLVKHEHLPYDLISTATVAEAVACLKETQFDIALIDHNLTDGSGFDVLAKAGELPCVFITGLDNTTTAVEAMKAGAYDYLVKDRLREYLKLLPTVIHKTLERKRNRDQLELQQQIINHLGEMVVYLDEKGEILFANPAIQTILGYSPAEVVGRPCYEGITPNTRQRQEFQTYISAFAKGEAIPDEIGLSDHFDIMLQRKDETQIWTNWSLSRRPQGGLICVGRDTTKRKNMEEALKRSQVLLEKRVEERTIELSRANQQLHNEIAKKTKTEAALKISEDRFKSLFVNAGDSIMIYNLEGDILEANQEACRRLGYSHEELLRLTPLDIITGIDADDYKKQLQELLQNGKAIFELNLTTKDGLIFQSEVNRRIIEYDSKPAVLSVERDISARKQVEAALRLSEERYRSLVENINEVIFTLDANLHINYISPAIEGITNYTPEEMTGQLLTHYLHPEDVASMETHFMHIQTGHKESCEFRMLAKDGTLRFIYFSGRAQLEDGIFTSINGVMSDLTEQKLTNTALLASQKLADIGTLTSEVMHEIKSPLQVITGISETLARQAEQKVVEKDYLTRQINNINRNAWRIAAIAQSLLNYARSSSGEIEACDLNEIVSDTLILIEHQLSIWSNINVNTQFAQELPVLVCERNKITQALINLLTNARDAMPNGGQINIRTGYDTAQDELYLQVEDMGVGIPEELQKKIFTPFFTTKPNGTGTGLGLSIITEIVRQQNGRVTLSSVTGKGTIFTLRFPTQEKIESITMIKSSDNFHMTSSE